MAHWREVLPSFTKLSGKCERPARPRCGSRFTRVRLGGGRYLRHCGVRRGADICVRRKRCG